MAKKSKKRAKAAPKAGPVHKVLHYKDELKCNHGGEVNLDPTEERDTEIEETLRVLTDVDLLQKVTISGCSLKCTKIVAIPVGLAKDVELRSGAIPVLANLKATTDKGCVVKFAGAAGGAGWDAAKAVAELNRNARDGSIHRCAAYVKTAIQAGGGGIPYINAASAYMLDGKLQDYSFEEVASNGAAGYTPQAGDVAVFPAVGKHVDGHTAMWNGKQWVSDFRQGDIQVWRDQPNASYKIFRHKEPKKKEGGAKGNQAHAGPK